MGGLFTKPKHRSDSGDGYHRYVVIIKMTENRVVHDTITVRPLLTVGTVRNIVQSRYTEASKCYLAITVNKNPTIKDDTGVINVGDVIHVECCSIVTHSHIDKSSSQCYV